MAPKQDYGAVGSMRVIDGRVWVVVAVYPIKTTTGSPTTGDK